MKYKFRAIHLLTDIESEREKRSIESVSQLQKYGIEYIQIINKIYEDTPPESNCRRPEKISKDIYASKNDQWILTSRHYGCYLAHKTAIEKYLTEDMDGILIFESDAIENISIDLFISKLIDAYESSIKNDIFMFTFGFRHDGITREIFNDINIISQFIECHAYLIPYKSKKILLDLFEHEGWDSVDLFYTCVICDRHKELKIGIFDKKNPMWIQAKGESLLNIGSFKNTEDYWKNQNG